VTAPGESEAIAASTFHTDSSSQAVNPLTAKLADFR
jgi:hypothetical protein